MKTTPRPSTSTTLTPKTYLQSRQETINWLSAHGLPALPVAPAQEARKYHKLVKSKLPQGVGEHCPLTTDLQPLPLFTGKNPSYLDEQGQPHLINHQLYQKQLPSDQDLRKWFANPNNGVGTLGGWNNTIWLDFDVKQFQNEEDCTLGVTKILQQEALANTFIERTHSGGWRIGVRIQQKPDFTNLALTPGGKHVGEALGEGRFTVLAPTIGPSGNPYQSINRSQPVMVESLGSIGIYSTKSTHPSKTPHNITPPVAIPGSIPLEMLGNTTSREILNGANPTGDRSQALATALQEWYGWHNWAQDNGLALLGDVETLAHHAGGQLGIDSDRINRIIKTIDPASCHPAAWHRGGDSSCWKKISRLDRATFVAKCPTHIKDSIQQEWGKNIGNSGRRYPSSHKIELNGAGSKELSQPFLLRDRILNILAHEPSQSQQKEELIELATQTGHSLRTIEQLAGVIESEIEFGIDTTIAAKNLSNLLSTRKTHLNLTRYLEPWFAKRLIETATAMPTAPEFLFTTLLATAASRIGTAAQVVIKPSGQYTQPMVIWSALVADSGAMKTPAQRVIIEPLIARETAAADAYEQQLDEYTAETERRKLRKGQDLEESVRPVKPIRKRYITKDITLETLQRIHGENPRGLLYYRDELVGMHKSRNAYRGGVGADEEAELDQHNGSAIIYDRGDKSICLARSAISRTGSIQWEVLADIMGNHGDFNGQFARWLFCATKAPKRYLRLLGKETDVDTGISQALEQLYQNLEKLAPRDYLLSFDAKQLFELWQHKLVDAQLNEPEGRGISLVYPKIEGYTARLALWLHIVNATLRNEAPTQVISAQTMELAIELAAYFLWQHRLIHAHNSPEAGAMPLLMKIHSFATRVGRATASSLKSGIRDLKHMVTAKIRELMKAAALSGMGHLEGEGNQLVYIPESVLTSVNFDKELAQVSTATTIAHTGFETGIDVLDKAPRSQESPGSSDPLSPVPSSAERQFVNELSSTLVSEPDLAVDTDHQFSSQLTQDDPWLFPNNLEDMADSLCQCDYETLLLLIEAWPVYAIKAAAVLLEPERHQQIEEWLERYNQEQLEPEPEADVSIPEPQPTLAELQALLLACQSLTELRHTQAKYKEQAEDAYRSLPLENQLQLDGLEAKRYNFPIYKYWGDGLSRHTLRHGALVRLKNDKMRQIATDVFPLEHGFKPNSQERVISVNPKHLIEVPRFQAPPAGQQLSLDNHIIIDEI